MTISQAREALMEGTLTSAALVKKAADEFEADKKSAVPMNAFLEIYDDAASLAEAADKEIAAAFDKDMRNAILLAEKLGQFGTGLGVVEV